MYKHMMTKDQMDELGRMCRTSAARAGLSIQIDNEMVGESEAFVCRVSQADMILSGQCLILREEIKDGWQSLFQGRWDGMMLDLWKDIAERIAA